MAAALLIGSDAMGIDAAGEAVTGALLGRAVEPHAGEGGHGGHGHICLNCGTALTGDHCHRCGQSGHVHRSLSGIGHEILHGVVHADGKLWRTLPLLALRPGELTRRYIEGERARFVSPMALFLFSIFIMFAVFSMVGLTPPADLSTSPGTRQELSEARMEIAKARGDAARRKQGLRPGDPVAKQIDREIATLDAMMRSMGGGLSVREKKGASFNIGIPWIDHGIEKMQKNPSLALYKLQSNSYKFSWLLIPLSLPFVWLLFFWKRQYHLYDHMVFVTYSIAFMSLLFIAVSLAGAAGVSAGWITLVVMTVPVLHIYRQLKGAYQLRRRSSILRTLVLLVFIWVVLISFFLILLALGAMG